ncbi:MULTISPECIES: hypothetical protein [Anoxybacillaceae]|jgi:hypothetical protein|uniref:Mobile element protein n=2 Tax=Anoxybacillaceae TaxID=3120669 RepID=A0AB38QZV3_PARTM|nr:MULTISPECIES: hypothetical protein [Bacillaceae]MCX8047769.1 hypothetical protein [Anoxybacillus gonensis]MDO0878155.1 hypothetical protein [Anoxybacillus gonensis]QNU24334.1 hypothetical protein IC806_15155 [Geobacillus zalihae]UOE77152.1 hypothetical protein IMI45_04655 [Parageobacillus thermoglucosidasius]
MKPSFTELKVPGHETKIIIKKRPHVKEKTLSVQLQFHLEANNVKKNTKSV